MNEGSTFALTEYDDSRLSTAVVVLRRGGDSRRRAEEHATRERLTIAMAPRQEEVVPLLPMADGAPPPRQTSDGRDEPA